MKNTALSVAAGLLLAGCAATPQQMAQQSNWDVCRFTMGGPHSQVAQNEASRRGLDCTPLYPAIAAQMQAQSAAIANFQRSIAPAPAPLTFTPIQRPQVNCTSYRLGNTVQTDCR
jgi:hypothetical protein